jgi:hypothetical protein
MTSAAALSSPSSRRRNGALGVHIKAAIQWQKISAGDWAAYAADMGSRLQH